MIWFQICIALFLFQFTFASDLCRQQTSCKCVINSTTAIDLTAAGKIDYPLFLDVALNETCDHTELYSYNPCYEFDFSGEHTRVGDHQKPCTGAAACVKIPGGSGGELPEEHAIGVQKNSIFGQEDDGSIFIIYTVPDTKKQLKVFLTCSYDEKHSLAIIQPECEKNDLVILNFTSKCACLNGCSSEPPSSSKPGLSTGSKLLIAFFTILLAYVIVGVLWNFCNGAQGAEIVPNLQFWNELPVLIMEGISFTCSCFGKRPTYNEV